MDYDSESSLENGRKKRDENSSLEEERRSSWRLVNAASSATGQTKAPLGAAASRALSSQVMEYYQKYAQNANLHQYFALPTSNNYATESSKYYYSILELSPKYIPGRQSCIGQEYNLKSCIPKERRRWVRPPLIGQSSSAEGSSIYVKSMTEQQSTNFDSQQDQDDEQQQERALHHEQSPANTSSTDDGLVITEEKAVECSLQEPHQEDQHSDQQQQPLSLNESTTDPRKAPSPTSSVASHKPPLEWDSGADVGYLHLSSKRLSTLERMALARGCSAALRLDPEGVTTEQQQQSPTAAVQSLTSKANGSGNGLSKALAGKPDANSTPLLLPGNISGSESEIEITPIVKNHLPGIVAGDEIKSDEVASSKSRKELLKEAKDTIETPKSANVFKIPLALKFPQEDSNQKPTATTTPLTLTPTETIVSSKKIENPEDDSKEVSPLKKSSSMNLLASPTCKYPLKRSQSELNLCGNDKPAPRLIFNSTSSIATVVNNQKPMTCNKQIQTSLKICAQESVGVQVSVPKEEDKPPLPKRATSLGPRSLNSILKSSKSTYKVQNPKTSSVREASTSKEEEQNENEKDEESSSDSSNNASLTPQADDTENVTGRANSFEYFPGHIYENVPNGSTSHVSSVDTGRSNSTMPNTSSSIDEKLWGDSDSLVRDLERSVKILKNLVDANKLDRQVKKRLIHHVVKRLVTAKYTDDKIEHNLEENVPWNPADARNKVYRAEIIQALAKNTTDSSDDWKPSQKKKTPKKTAPTNEARPIEEIVNIPAEIESSNSDKFDRNTDRTVMDGRKARMGLRADDCGRQCSSNTPTNKSESSECFLPQRVYNKNEKMKDMFITSTSNSSPQDQNRALLDAVVNSRRSPVNSSNEVGNSADWRMPTTVSERRYKLMYHCNDSDSGDTKLVSYAEMEKRNQLIWITNEISHLSNLKKLLEQTKNKPERSKSSPRKPKPSCSKPQKSLPPTSHSRHQNGDILVEDGQLNRQWSSHCNLANCPSPGSNSVKCFKKRNSCTQTAIDYLEAYSRTGSEIVSARIHSPNTKLVNAHTQTPRHSLNSTPVCIVHSNIPSMHCMCGTHVCQCCTTKNVPMQQYFYTDDEKDEYQSETKSENTKKTKNQLNATKLRCTCQINEKVRPKPKDDRSKISTSTSQTSHHRHCEGSMCSCGRLKLPEMLSCQCGRDCECENKNLDRRFERLQINKPPKKKLFEKSTTTSCSCECKGNEGSLSANNNHHSSKKGQSYFSSKSSREDSSQSCHCGNKIKNRSKSYPSPQLSVRTNDTTTSDCKCCRICGTVYQKDRSCNCVPKNYPKGVAYELAFFDEDVEPRDSETGQCRKVNMEIKSIEKNVPIPNSRSRGRVKLPNHGNGTRCNCGGLQRAVKHSDCEYREEHANKFNMKKNGSLQEYLISNNPGFADNVEMRRQYVSEIQRLRQLRKDSRVQVLAMATTNNVFAPPEQPKIIKSVKKKLSDEEMRGRLRKRYFQLSEVRAKRRQQQLQEEARCNKLMAKIFCKKLQQKVLRGQVDLSQSVSVISNL